MPCRATQDRWVICRAFWQNVIHSRRECKPPQYTCHENLMNCIKAPKDMTPKMSPPGLKVSHMLLGKSGGELPIAPEWMNGRPKRIWCSVVDVSSDKSKIQCRKKQHRIGTWSVRSTNQRKLDSQEEMGGINIILAISELKWTGMGELNSNDHYIYYLEQ